MLATSMATKKPTAKKKPEGRKKSLLTQEGDRAAFEAKRKMLLRVLKENDWNLTATAEALEMGTNVSVIQALQELAPEEYAAAKTDGRVSPGKRRE